MTAAFKNPYELQSPEEAPNPAQEIRGSVPGEVTLRGQYSQETGWEFLV